MLFKRINSYYYYKNYFNKFIVIALFSLLLFRYHHPKISIFMPIYNKEKYISKAIKNIQNQTLKDIEIVAVNDCSNDKSLDILNDFAKKDSRIKIINNKKNNGLLYSRAIGILHSSGDYLMNIDADDELISQDSLEFLYNQTIFSKADIISFNFLSPNRTLENSCSIFDTIIKQPKLFKSIYTKDYTLRDFLIWDKLIKKKIFLKAYNLFKDYIYSGKIWNYFEDNIWSILVNKFAKTKLCVDKLVYIYNYNENSLMHKKLGIIEFENLLYRHEMYKRIFSSKEDEKYLIAEYYFLLNRLKEQINDVLLINDHKIKEHILRIFQHFLKNYNHSKEKIDDINNFLKLINI